MTLLISTGLKNAMLAVIPGIFNGGACYVYGDPPGTLTPTAQPATAQAAPTGTLLAVISNRGLAYTLGTPGNGLLFTNGSRGIVVPDGTQIDPSTAQPTWGMLGLVTGVPTWARLLTNDDTLNDSATLSRMDFAVNPEAVPGAGSELQIALPLVTAGEIKTVGYFLYGIPPFD